MTTLVNCALPTPAANGRKPAQPLSTTTFTSLGKCFMTNLDHLQPLWARTSYSSDAENLQDVINNQA
jgi:hypothetical protein